MQVEADENLLREVESQIIDRGTCQDRYASFGTMLCADVPEGGKDACTVDGGGALYCKKSGEQVGIVSWSLGCAQQEYPGVYANLADKEVNDFIEKEIKKIA